MDLVITIFILIAVQLVLYFILKSRIDQELNASKLLKNVQDEINDMVRELNVSAERNIGLLENKISELESLLGKADQKVLLLNKEVQRREKTAEVYSHLKRPPVSEPSRPELELEAPAPPEPEIPAPVEPPVSLTPLTTKDRVLAGRNEGWDAAEIARRTGLTRSEVELILSLNTAV